MTENEEILLGIIIWLRNHYDVGRKTEKKKVLKRVDLIINHFDPPMRCLETAREFAKELEASVI